MLDKVEPGGIIPTNFKKLGPKIELAKINIEITQNDTRKMGIRKLP